jgi:hypothetical protein
MPDVVVPMSDEAEAALIFKRSPGGLASLNPEERVRLEKIQDVQFERAEDLLKGILLYTKRESALAALTPTPEKMAVK